MPNFRAAIGGKSVAVKSVAYDSSPRRIVLLLDASRSMFSESGADFRQTWKAVVLIANDFLAYMPPSTQIGLAIFAEQIELLVKPTTDRNTLVKTLASFASPADLRKNLGVRAALVDAVNASSMLGEPRLGDAVR